MVLGDCFMDDDALELAARLATAYRRQVAVADATPVASYAQMLAAFATPTPETGMPPRELIAELAEKAGPGIRAMTAPRFFGWVIGGSLPAGVAADWLTSAWGQNVGLAMGTPAASAIEQVVSGWLLDLLDLPRESSVGLVTGATVASFTCLAAARHEVLQRAGWNVEKDGLFGAPPIHVVLGEDAHAAVFCALKYLGLGAGRVRKVACDDQGRMRADDFARALQETDGPAITVLQAGQINTGAFDPFAELVPLARARGAWIHIDGAFGLWARACPSLRHLADGLEGADSWATDGHKWLQTPYDCGYAIVRHEEAHRQAMVVTASYLPAAQTGEREPSHYVPELSRRARGFPTWAMIKNLGRAGIAEMVERDCRVARLMAARLAAAGATIGNEVCLNQVVARFGEGDAGDRLTLAVVARVQEEGATFVGPVQWRGRWFIRISVSGATTQESDGEIACDAILKALADVRGQPDQG
jgi:glutamate/tyrosine decarboxylase-like PLP-dependent enzyme